jgi:hypothetical protein
MAKDSGFRIRLDDNLRQTFLRACKQQDKSAAQVIREFMRRYVDKRVDTSQGELFPTGAARPADRRKGD